MSAKKQLMNIRKVTRADQRKATKDLEGKLCLRAFLVINRRIDRMPKRLQRRVILATWALISP